MGNLLLEDAGGNISFPIHSLCFIPDERGYHDSAKRKKGEPTAKDRSNPDQISKEHLARNEGREIYGS